MTVRTVSSALSFQLRVPVREVEEVPPRRMELARTEVAYGMPARLPRLRDQPHRRFLRAAVALLDVAGEARAHHVLPVRAPSAGQRDHVVERQLGGGELVAAVLAAVAVAQVDVVTGELDFLPRQ